MCHIEQRITVAPQNDAVEDVSNAENTVVVRKSSGEAHELLAAQQRYGDLCHL